MKILYRIILTICFFIFMSSSLEAQTQRKRFTSDIHFGLNFAEMDIEGANMYKQPKLGVSLGANFNYKILHNIQLQTGFYVTKKGLKQHIETDNVDGSNDVGIRYIGDTVKNIAASYIQVPLCIGYEVYLTKKFAFNINAGGYLAYGFKGHYKIEGYAKEMRGDEVTASYPLYYVEGESFALQRFNRFDYGAIASVGFIYDIYTLNFNYEHGLHNVTDDGRVLKNRNISILLGFRF